MGYFDVANRISMADRNMTSSVSDTISTLVDNALDAINDVLLACMTILRSVPDDISMFVTDCSGIFDDASLENTYDTYFAPYDICLDDTERARISCSIWAAVTDFRRFMPDSIRIYYTEMLGISLRRSESS